MRMEVEASVGLIFLVLWLAFYLTSWVIRHRPTWLHGKPVCGRAAREGWRDRRSTAGAGSEGSSGGSDAREDWPGEHRFHVQHLSHRGSILEGHVENTIPAFAHAVSVGTELIELDVWLTKDEQLLKDWAYHDFQLGMARQVVVYHDKNFQRLCGVEGLIYETNFDELPPIKHPSEGSTAAIPSFESVLDTIPTTLSIIVEFKYDHPVLIEKVHAILTRRGKLPYTIWYSLNDRINAKLGRFDPSLPRITSIRSMARLAFLYTSGLLPFLPHSWAFQEDIYLAFYMELTYEQVVKDWKPMPDWRRKIILWFMQGKPCRILVPPGFTEHLRQRGIPTWLVGINNEEDMRGASTLGATGAMTDKPMWLHSLREGERLPLPSLAAPAASSSPTRRDSRKPR